MMTDDPDPGKKTFDSEGLAILLVAISVLCIVTQIGIMIFLDCGVWDKIKGSSERDETKEKPAVSTKVAPAMSPTSKRQLKMKGQARQRQQAEMERERQRQEEFQRQQQQEFQRQQEEERLKQEEQLIVANAKTAWADNSIKIK